MDEPDALSDDRRLGKQVAIVTMAGYLKEQLARQGVIIQRVDQRESAAGKLRLCEAKPRESREFRIGMQSKLFFVLIEIRAFARRDAPQDEAEFYLHALRTAAA
jgi:hypothetical protein